ncbi:16S rRNA (cytosine(1402)-N(4))-methyltransferase RsmH [Candidatus Gracilibacteria bacterium]|nr:16S rRNA (cytosine(1402)-N(4))-methyltransferase RsmH [Candidatus Gracilibacteria bacterium]
MHHDPVLFDKVFDIYHEISPRKYVIDATQGLGGHTRMLVEGLDKDGICIGIDRDIDNIKIADENLKNVKNHKSVHSSFENIESILQEEKIDEIDFILYDLGVSSAHYDDASRGFSFRFDGPLDMRFDRTTGKSASEFLMKASEKELVEIFRKYADEKKPYFVARAILESQKEKPIETTSELVKIIEAASFDKKSVMRVFQALRIAVNDEFGHVERSLHQAIKRLRIEGKIAVITFHSIEDRIVKKLFAEYLQDEVDDFTGMITKKANYKKYTKKPILPDEEEIEANPRARSAKLRVLTRIS